MAFKVYNTHVKFEWPGAIFIELPVTDLTVTPEPYTGASGTVVTLFDGRRKQEPVTWGYRVELVWNELREAQDDVRSVVVNALAYPEQTTIHLDRNDDGTYNATRKLTNLLPELSGKEVVAKFERRARKRPGTLVFLTASQQLPYYNWLAS